MKAMERVCSAVAVGFAGLCLTLCAMALTGLHWYCCAGMLLSLAAFYEPPPSTVLPEQKP